MKRSSGLQPAADAESQHRARALRQILLRQRVIRAGRQARDNSPSRPADGLRRNCATARALREWHSMRSLQRLHALQEQERIEGAQRRAEIAQPFHARLHDVGEVAEGLVEA